MKDLSGHSPSEIIQKLLDGELTNSESKKFSDMINSNPEYKKEFNDFKRIKESINSDKKQQFNSSIPDPVLKNNIFKELGLGKAVETPVAIGGGGRLVQFGAASLTSTLSWLMNYKVSVPSLAVVTAFTFFALWNNNGNEVNSINSNTSTKIGNVVKSENTKSEVKSSKNIPVVSANSGKSNTTNVDKFEGNLDKKDKTNNKENLAICTVDGIDNKKSNDKTEKTNKSKSKQISTNYVNNGNLKINTENVETNVNNEAIIEIPNKEKKEGVLLLVENGLFHNSYSLAELRSEFNRNPIPSFNVITPLKSNRNNTNENSNVGVTVLFSGMNQLSNNEFTAAGYWKVNNNLNYLIELGVEYNRVFLAPFVIDPLGNNGKFDGVGIGGRFESNGLLSEFMGKTFGELINPYAGISLGQVNPGLYSKFNAGVQLNLVQINNINLQFTAGYEYFGLIQQSSQFQSARQGVVTGIMVKF
jgi:hypothetical protein